MTGFHRALMQYWAGMGIPIYLSGCVDDQATFPYFTINIADGNLMGATILTATSWHRKGAEDAWTDVMTERLAVMDTVQRRLPAGGIRIRFDGGYAILNRNDDNFIAYIEDPEDPNVIGGRVSYEVRFFHV